MTTSQASETGVSECYCHWRWPGILPSIPQPYVALHRAPTTNGTSPLSSLLYPPSATALSPPRTEYLNSRRFSILGPNQGRLENQNLSSRAVPRIGRANKVRSRDPFRTVFDLPRLHLLCASLPHRVSCVPFVSHLFLVVLSSLTLDRAERRCCSFDTLTNQDHSHPYTCSSLTVVSWPQDPVVSVIPEEFRTIYFNYLY